MVSQHSGNQGAKKKSSDIVIPFDDPIFQPRPRCKHCQADALRSNGITKWRCTECGRSTLKRYSDRKRIDSISCPHCQAPKEDVVSNGRHRWFCCKCGRQSSKFKYK